MRSMPKTVVKMFDEIYKNKNIADTCCIDKNTYNIPKENNEG